MVNSVRLRPWSALAWCGLALAGIGSPTAAFADEPVLSDEELGSDPYAWIAPDVETQLAADTLAIPEGMGAVFVPYMSDPGQEPPVLVVSDDDVVTGRVGERVIVPPGRYVVVMSSGTPKQGTGTPVQVIAGETAVVEPTWGGLRVDVVDDKLIPHRGGYEILRVDDRQVYGTGFGVDTLQGEKLQTWLLPPGLYRIVQTGGTYRARTDFATVNVPESGFVRFRLVMDPDSGEFRGAGVLMPGEFGTPRGWPTASKRPRHGIATAARRPSACSPGWSSSR